MENLIQTLKDFWPFIKAHPYLSIPLVYFAFLAFRWYSAKRLGRTTLFTKIRDLDPQVFFGTKYQEFYFTRPADEEIKDSLDNRKPVLITGIPMAGKTRAAYEAIKKFPDHYILAPYPPRLNDLNLSDYRLWPLFRDWLYPWRKIKVILLLNDLTDYTKGISPREGIDGLQALVNSLKGVTASLLIVATSRSQEAEELRRDAPDLLDTFQGVELGKISDSERQEIEDKIKEPSGEFDGTIGSILLGKERMRDCLIKKGEEAQAVMWSIALLLKARIIPPEEGLVRTVCEKVFKRSLDPVSFNNLVTTLRSDGLILKPSLLPSHPSYAEENFLDKDLSLHLADLKGILKERRHQEELCGLATAFYLNRNYTEAVEILGFILSEIDPKDANVWNNKGVALGKLDKHQESLDCFDKALEIDPKHAPAWYNKGVALGKLGRYQGALDSFNKALEIDTKDAQAWGNKGAALVESGRHQEALDCFDKALEIDPKDAQAWYNRGVALGKLGRPPEEKLTCYDKALEIDPKHAPAWYNKGVTLVELGRHQEAIDCYDKALEIDPKDAKAWHSKGAALGKLGREREAIECFDKALEIDSKDARSWHEKGTTLRKLNRQQEALTCYDKALEIDPKFTQAWYNKVLALGKLGRVQEKLHCYDKILEIDPKNALAWTSKGLALGKLGRYQEALNCYNKALEINPKLAQTWYNKGLTLGKLGRPPQEELTCYDKALEINPKLAQTWYNKAMALRKLRRPPQEELTCYNKALEIDTNDAQVWYNKGV
ncbi:MAG: tetratricopeptide repeat protein, partial [Candidatus Brocadiales bacterium]